MGRRSIIFKDLERKIRSIWHLSATERNSVVSSSIKGVVKDRAGETDRSGRAL